MKDLSKIYLETKYYTNSFGAGHSYYFNLRFINKEKQIIPERITNRPKLVTHLSKQYIKNKYDFPTQISVIFDSYELNKKYEELKNTLLK